MNRFRNIGAFIDDEWKRRNGRYDFVIGAFVNDGPTPPLCLHPKYPGVLINAMMTHVKPRTVVIPSTRYRSYATRLAAWNEWYGHKRQLAFEYFER